MGLFDGWFGAGGKREGVKLRDFKPGQKVRSEADGALDWEVVKVDGGKVLIQPIVEEGTITPKEVSLEDLSSWNEEVGFETIEKEKEEEPVTPRGFTFERADKVKRFLDDETLEAGWVVLGKRPGGKLLIGKMKEGAVSPELTAVVDPDQLEPDDNEKKVDAELSTVEKPKKSTRENPKEETELVHVGKQEIAKREQKPDGPNRNPGKKEKFKLVFADTSALVDDRAHDMAERFMEETAAEAGQGFWRSLPRRIWKGGLFREVYRQREISRVKREITQGENLYAGENQDRTQHAEAMSGIVRRFISEYEDTVHRDLGEAREKYTEEGMEDEKLRAQLTAVKAQVRELVTAYACGEISDETFPAERTRVLSQIKKLSPSVVIDGQMYADNLGEIARQVRLSVEHGEGLEALDLDFDIIVGRAKGGVRTEANYNTFDKLVKKLQKVPVLKYIADEAWAGTAAAAAYSFTRVAAQATLNSRLAAWGSFGATAAFAGVMGAQRKSRLLKEDRAAHARQMAQGDTTVPGSAKREQMDGYRLETRSANDLVDNLETILYEWNPDGSRAIRELGEEEVNAALVALAEIEARVRVSDGPNNNDKVDLLSYSRFDQVEQEHARLDIARAEAKANLRRLLGGEVTPGAARYPGEGDVYTRPELTELFEEAEYRGASEDEQTRRIEGFLLARKLERGIAFADADARREFNASNRSQAELIWRRAHGAREARIEGEPPTSHDFDSRLDALVEGRICNLVGEKTEKDSAFNKMRRSEAFKAGVLTAVVAGTLGVAAQEGAAFFKNDTQGLVETGVEKLGLKAHHFGDKVTALEDLRHWIGGDMPDAAGPLHEIIMGSNSHLSLPEGMSAVPNPNGTFSLEWGNNKIDGLILGPDGLLDPDSIAKLQAAGLTPSGLIEHASSSVAGPVTPEQYLQDHSTGTGHVSRDLWWDNDTPKPVFDHNELKLWWGGANNSGIDGKNFVFNIEQMTQGGSFHGGLSADAVELIKEGKMSLLLSVSEGTQSTPFVVPIDVHGNAIIDPGSPAYQLFQNSGGSAEFLGKFAEVAQVTGSEAGVDHVQIFATHVGNGMDTLTGVTQTVEEIPRMIIDAPQDYTFYPPPVIPLFKNIPLEKTTRGKKPEPQKPGIVKHEKAGELIKKELGPIVTAIKKIDWDKLKEIDPNSTEKIGPFEVTGKDRVKYEIEKSINAAIDKLPEGMSGAYNLDVRNLLKTFGIKFVPVDERGHIKITSMKGLEQVLWSDKSSGEIKEKKSVKEKKRGEKKEFTPEMVAAIRSNIENAIRRQEPELGWAEIRINVSSSPANRRGERGEDEVKKYTEVAGTLGYSSRYWYSEEQGGTWVITLSKKTPTTKSPESTAMDSEKKEKVRSEQDFTPDPLTPEEQNLAQEYWLTIGEGVRGETETSMKEWIEGSLDKGGKLSLALDGTKDENHQKTAAFKELALKMGYELGEFKLNPRGTRVVAPIRKVDLQTSEDGAIEAVVTRNFWESKTPEERERLEDAWRKQIDLALEKRGGTFMVPAKEDSWDYLEAVKNFIGKEGYDVGPWDFSKPKFARGLLTKREGGEAEVSLEREEREEQKSEELKTTLGILEKREERFYSELSDDEKRLAKEFWEGYENDDARKKGEARLRDLIKEAAKNGMMRLDLSRKPEDAEFNSQKIAAMKEMALGEGLEVSDFTEGLLGNLLYTDTKVRIRPGSEGKKTVDESALADEFWKSVSEEDRERTKATIEQEVKKAINKGSFEILTGGRGKPTQEDAERISAYLRAFREKGYDFSGKPRFYANGRMRVVLKKNETTTEIAAEAPEPQEEEEFNIRDLLEAKKRLSKSGETVSDIGVSPEKPRSLTSLEKMFRGTASRDRIKEQSKKFWERQTKEGRDMNAGIDFMVEQFNQSVQIPERRGNEPYKLVLHFKDTPIENIEEAIGAWRELGLRNGLVISSFNVLPNGNDVEAFFKYDRKLDMELQEMRQGQVMGEAAQYRNDGKFKNWPTLFREKMFAREKMFLGREQKGYNNVIPKEKGAIKSITEPYEGEALTALDQGAKEKKFLERITGSLPQVRKNIREERRALSRIVSKLKREDLHPAKRIFNEGLRREAGKKLFDLYSQVIAYGKKVGDTEAVSFLEKRRDEFLQLKNFDKKDFFDAEYSNLESTQKSKDEKKTDEVAAASTASVEDSLNEKVLGETMPPQLADLLARFTKNMEDLPVKERGRWFDSISRLHVMDDPGKALQMAIGISKRAERALREKGKEVTPEFTKLFDDVIAFASSLGPDEK